MTDGRSPAPPPLDPKGPRRHGGVRAIVTGQVGLDKKPFLQQVVDLARANGREVKLFKLAQLGLWLLHSAFYRSGGFRLEDISRMTAFADYILPVALRLMGIFTYSPALSEAVEQRHLIPRDSTQEIEIRAHTLYATALLTEEINKLRPADRKVIIPQIDARLWTHYHATFLPHHLTRTIMY